MDILKAIFTSMALIVLAGCNPHQSALSTFGEEARSTATLTLFLGVGAVVIFIGTAALYIHGGAGTRRQHELSSRHANSAVVGRNWAYHHPDSSVALRAACHATHDRR